MGKFVRYFILLAAFIVVAGSLYVFFNRQNIILRTAEKYGIKNIDVSMPEWGRLVIEKVSTGKGLEIKKAVVLFSSESLEQKRIKSISVKGLVLTAVQKENSLDLGGIVIPLSQEKASTETEKKSDKIIIPFDTAEIENAEISYRKDDLNVSLNSGFSFKNQSVRADVKNLEVLSGSNRVKADLKVVLDDFKLSGKSISGSLNLDSNFDVASSVKTKGNIKTSVLLNKSGEKIDFSTTSPLKLSFEKFDLGDNGRFLEPVSFDADAKLSFDGEKLSGNSSVKLKDSRIAFSDKNEAKTIVTKNRLLSDISYGYDEKNGFALKELKITDTEILRPSEKLKISGVNVGVIPCKDRTYCVDADIEQLVYMKENVPVFSVKADVKADKEKAEFNLTAKTLNEKITFEADGKHVFKSVKGDATIRMYPVFIDDEENPAKDVLPVIAGFIDLKKAMLMAAAQIDWEKSRIKSGAEFILRNVTAYPVNQEDTELALGQLAFSAKAERTEDNLVSDGTILVENFNVENSSSIIKNINSVIDIESLYPFKLKPEQVLSIEVANVGLPLTNGEITFSVRPDGVYEAHKVDFKWGGGSVGAKDVVIDTKKEKSSAVLVVNDVDLGEILKLLNVEGLSADGLLYGRIPVVINRNRPEVVNAELKTRGKGNLVYNPSQNVLGSGIQGKLLLQALSKFRYEELGITTKAAGKDNVLLKFVAHGINQDFYDGYPITLELNVKGSLGDLLEQGRYSYQVPEVVKDRMQRFGK